MTPGRFPPRPLALAAVLLALCVNAGARQQQPADGARAERLVGLAKVWAAAKYFHPHLAYREIDWDRALVEAIPKVRSAETPEEYRAALNQMLGALGDAGARAESAAESAAATPTAASCSGSASSRRLKWRRPSAASPPAATKYWKRL